jgi:hypothetical protein
MMSLSELGHLLLEYAPTILTGIVVVLSYIGIIHNNKKHGMDTRHYIEHQLKSLNGTARAIIHSWPGPCWLKTAKEEGGDVIFRMTDLNEKYSLLYGIERLHYIGRTDLEAGHSRENAHKYRNNDLMVWASGKPRVFEEPGPPDGMNKKFLKVRLMSEGGKLKGVMGFGMDTKVWCNPEGCEEVKKILDRLHELEEEVYVDIDNHMDDVDLKEKK